jgi:hypothetical protein
MPMRSIRTRLAREGRGRRLLPPERRGQRRRDAIGVKRGKDGSKFKDGKDGWVGGAGGRGRRGAFWISEAFESWEWFSSLPLGGRWVFLSAMSGHEIIRGLVHNRPA